MRLEEEILVQKLSGNFGESGGLFFDGALGGEPFHGTGAVESVDTPAIFQDVVRVVGFGNGSAVAQHDDVVVDAFCGVHNGIDQCNAFLEGFCGLRADGTGGGEAHVRDEDIGAGIGHVGGVFRIKDVGGGEEIEIMREADHLDFLVVAHIGFFEIGAEDAVDEADRGEILDARESGGFHLREELGHEAHGVCAADAGEDGSFADDGEDFAGHFHDDGVGIAIGHEAREGAVARHAVSAGIVDDNQIDSARFFAFGADAGACAAADDGFSFSDLSTEAF